MTEHQNNEYQLLMLFKKICEENSLRYWLIGGTLLGAVRHKGFIPWDDDIDVAMPEDDFRKFLSLGCTLPEPYCIQTEANDPFYPFLFAKLCDTSKPFPHSNRKGPMGCYIDIFPFEYCKRPNLLSRFKFNITNIISYVLQIKLEWTEDRPYRNLFARIMYIVFRQQSVERLRKIRTGLLNSIKSKSESDYFVSIAGTYKAECEFYPISWFCTEAQMDFEGQMLQVPCGWHECLTQNYSNYMILPPKNERVARHSK